MVTRGAVFKHLSKLIEFDTTSCNSNLPCAQYIAEFLSSHGVASKLVYNSDKTKANLYATIGPKDKRGIMLSGHMDVVPVTDQKWDTNPFCLTEKDDGRWYGRGTCDMKGFLALCLAFVPSFTAAADKMRLPIHFGFTYDEEVGCVGVRTLCDELKSGTISPLPLCGIIGEPTLWTVVNGHKGKRSYDVDLRGFTCHSSLTTQGVNAVEHGANLVHFLRQKATEFKTNGPHHPDFEPTFTTVHTGVFQGGTALNIVPDSAKVVFEFRNIPSHNADAIFSSIKEKLDAVDGDMKKEKDTAGLSYSEQSCIACLETPKDAPVVPFTQRLAGSEDVPVRSVGFGTDAGRFAEIGIPCVVCGPGSIEQAHKANEWLDATEVDRGLVFFERLVAYTCDNDGIA
mmetsp:Transcript_45825/g.115401  ORF Transcript_45825/g.115401 Transcript_45825/m.115401 type:complete len:398 (-) Transcript_45825:168-1361(-)